MKANSQRNPLLVFYFETESGRMKSKVCYEARFYSTQTALKHITCKGEHREVWIPNSNVNKIVPTK